MLNCDDEVVHLRKQLSTCEVALKKAQTDLDLASKAIASKDEQVTQASQFSMHMTTSVHVQIQGCDSACDGILESSKNY